MASLGQFLKAANIAGETKPSHSPAQSAPVVATPPTAPVVSTQSKLAGMFAKPQGSAPSQVQPKELSQSAEDILTLEDLADTEIGSGLAQLDSTPSTRSIFPDETPANAPTRDLPPEADKATIQFADMLDKVYGFLHDPELLSQVIRNIMIELKGNPQYMKMVVQDDIRVWVRTMRDSMGMAKIKKEDTKARRVGGSKKSTAVDDDMAAAFAELGLGEL